MRRAVPALLGLVLLPMCGGSSNRSSATSTTIGPAGGAITSNDGVRIIVPAGALDRDVQIAITTSTEAAPNGYVARTPVYVFAPDGLVFKAPATIEVPLVAGLAAEDGIVWSSAIDGVKPLASTTSGRVMTASVMHFSRGFIGHAQSPVDVSDAGPQGCQAKYLVRPLDPSIVVITDLNDSGQFVGVVNKDNGSGYNHKPFVSSVGQAFETFGADQGLAVAINNSGAVVGTISRSQPSSFQGPFRWDPPTRPDPGPNGWGPGFHELKGYGDDNPTNSVLATLVTTADLTLGYGPTTALQFVSPGFGTLTVDSPSGCDPSDYRRPTHANEGGRVIGYCRDQATQDYRAVTFAQDVAHTATDLGRLPGAALGSRAHRVNKSGDVVGESRRASDGYLTATRWSSNDVASDLGALAFDVTGDAGMNCGQSGQYCGPGPLAGGTLVAGGCCASVASSINDASSIVGSSRGEWKGTEPRTGAFEGAKQYAVLWRGNAIEKLDDLTCSICTEPSQEAYEAAIPSNRPGHCLTHASAINNKGQIVAYGYDLRSHSFGYVLLEPAP